MRTDLGIGCLSVAGITLIILRAFRLIMWSWWWVTAPFWAPLAFWLIFLAFGIIVLKAKERKMKREEGR